MMRKSSSDACVNCGLPAHSPIAQTLGAVVSSRSLTRMYPRASNSTPASSSPMPAVLATRPAAARISLPSIFLLTGERTHGKADLLSGSALHIEGFSRHQNLNTFVTENSLHFVGDVGILAGHQLRTGLDYRHAAAEAAISLGH